MLFEKDRNSRVSKISFILIFEVNIFLRFIFGGMAIFKLGTDVNENPIYKRKKSDGFLELFIRCCVFNYAFIAPHKKMHVHLLKFVITSWA